jgi:hypothetical protein
LSVFQLIPEAIPNKKWPTEQVGLEEMFGFNFGLDTGYSEIFRGFPQYL